MSEKLSVMVVEDETIIRTSFVMALEDLGYNVVGEASNGEMALQLLESVKPDIILLDINLPKINGLKVLELIHDQYGIPYIIITGYYSEDFLERAKKAGAFSYLLKPIDPFQLQAALEVVQERAKEYRTSVEEQERLRIELKERKIIERAKGIVMKRQGVDEEAAMRWLQRRSRDRNTKLAETARKVIEADQLLN